MRLDGGRATHKEAQRVIRAKKRGQKNLKFHPGGLHESLGVKKGKKLTASEHAAARSGKEGKKAKKEEIFYENILKGRKK